jgi:hypothetical protein
VPLQNKLSWLDLGVFSGYVAAVFIAVAHHEPWADEAQSWLVARDLPFWKMIFSQMRYENSPGLWQTVLWLAQHVFHAPYSAMNYIGAVLAAAGAGVLIFCAPFPRPVRYLMSSSYYVAYQYAVIARPYVMLLLFGGLAAIFYRRRAPLRIAIAIALLCGSSVHGAIIAAAITMGAAWHVIVKQDWPVGQSRARYLAAAAIVVMAGIMLVVIVFPPADAGGEVLGIHKTTNLETFSDLLNHTIAEPSLIGACLLVALIVFAVRSGEPIVFVGSVGGILAFEWFIVVLPQHLGAIVVALIVSLWIAWPQERRWNPELAITSLVLGAMFAIQTVWAVSAWRHDFSAPYSGSKDAAIYLKQVGADHERIFGFCYPMVAIQAYFDRSIFANWPTAYLHATKNEEAGACVLEPQPNYDYLVTPVLQGDEDPYAAAIRSRGYVPVHVSPGRAFFKQGIWITETFVIYRRSF